MDAIGHALDATSILGELRPHFFGDFAMSNTDGVALAREIHRQRRHVEGFPPRCLVFPKVEEFLLLDLELWPVMPEVPLDERERKGVMTRRNRCVRREDARSSNVRARIAIR